MKRGISKGFLRSLILSCVGDLQQSGEDFTAPHGSETWHSIHLTEVEDYYCVISVIENRPVYQSSSFTLNVLAPVK